MGYARLIYDICDEVAWIRLNDPDTLNAMGPEMGRELLDALSRAESEARAIILTGEGRAFCSGANIVKAPLDLDDPARDAGGDLDGVYNPVVCQMRASRIPVVTAVRGAAAGVGCAVALAGDLIVASETARFYQAFVKIGLAPDGGSAYLLTRAIGRPRAMEMMLLGDKLDARRALEWGLINRVFEDAELEDRAFEIARSLAQGPASIAIIKRIAWSVLDASFETALANERVAQREAGRTDDFVEGMRAFQARRSPKFSGGRSGSPSRAGSPG